MSTKYYPTAFLEQPGLLARYNRAVEEGRFDDAERMLYPERVAEREAQQERDAKDKKQLIMGWVIVIVIVAALGALFTSGDDGDGFERPGGDGRDFPGLNY